MNTQKFTIGVITLVIAVILVTGVLIPVISNAVSEGGEYTNENPTFKFTKETENISVDMDINYVENSHALTLNANDVQEATLDDSGNAIIYVDNNIIVYISNSNLNILVKASGNVITENGGALQNSIYQHDDVVDVGNDYQSPAPEWAYIPDSTGEYGFYPAGAEIVKDEGSVSVQNVGTLAAISGTIEGMSPTLSSMLSIIPLIVTVGLILGAVTMFIRKS